MKYIIWFFYALWFLASWAAMTVIMGIIVAGLSIFPGTAWALLPFNLLIMGATCGPLESDPKCLIEAGFYLGAVGTAIGFPFSLLNSPNRE